MANNQLVNIKELAGLLCVSRRKAWQLAAGPDFPKRISLGARTIRWRLKDVERFLEKKSRGARR